MNNPYMDLMAELGGPDNDWRERAVCVEVDPETFFPGEGQGRHDARAQIEAAKAVCRKCPVQVQCLQWAIDTHQHHGVWGGRFLTEPRIPHRKRPTCNAGHDWTPENEVYETNGQRRCLLCRREYSARRARVKREQRQARMQGASS
mgnify:CR=1 FL=1